MYVLREARLSDLDALLGLAIELDTLNLPPEKPVLAELLEDAQRAFAGSRPGTGAPFDPAARFVFVLEAPSGEVVGTSMIHAQHGTLLEPHIFFRVDVEEAAAQVVVQGESRSVHLRHRVLNLGQSYDGPTEIGGLVLDPRHRRGPGQAGRLLSLSRFLFIASRRSCFRDRVLAELLPPLDRGADGRTRSPLWDALGSRFTGLEYAEADRLSRVDKAFIWKLFPHGRIHVALLPPEVQAILGEVGAPTIGAKRLLESVGFGYSGHVDPFDGGPHFTARTDEISVVAKARRVELDATPGLQAPEGLLAVEGEEGFRCVIGARIEGGGPPEAGSALRVDPAVLAALRVAANSPARWSPVR